VTTTLPLLAALSRLLLPAGRPCGISLPPGETEGGSAGAQPTKG